MRLLVVEDEAAVRHLIDRVLTRHGHHVVAALSADHATALLMEFPDPPDVGLLDLILPGMNGLAYAEQLSRQYPRIRFVFMTGWADAPHIPEAEARGSLLMKPFTIQTLLAAIGHV